VTFPLTQCSGGTQFSEPCLKKCEVSDCVLCSVFYYVKPRVSWQYTLLTLVRQMFCLKRLFPQVDYSYDLALDQLKLHTLHKRSYHLDALFLTQVYRGSKFCPSVLETVGLRVPIRYIRDFSMFSVCSSRKNCPSARCASAANVVCRDVDIFGTKPLSLKYIW
jgi:hypothetical protein